MDTGTPSGQAALLDTSSEPASPVHVTDGPVPRRARKGRSGSSKSSAVPSLENRAYATRLAIHTYWVGLLVSIAAALIVILTAIDVQSGRIPDTEGHGWAFSTLFGPDFGSGLNEQGLTVLTTEGELTAEGLTTLERLLGVHLVVDSIFAAVYTALLWLTVRTVAKGSWRTVGYVAVGLLLVVDLLENLFTCLVFFADWSISPVPIFTAAKWFLVIIVVAIVALSLIVPLQSADQRSPRKRLGRGFTALLHQRYSYVPVLAIFMLSIPSGAAILEQLPDVQRRWVFDGPTGLRHALAAMISTIALGLYLLAVGRRRTVSALSHRRRKEPDRTRSAAAYASTVTPTAGAGKPRRKRYYGVWAVPPAAALLGFAVIIAAGRSELILQGRLLIFIGVPLLLVIAGSAITGRVWETKIAKERGWPRPYQPLTYTLEEGFAIGIAGTIAGVAAVVVGGLSLLRAFTPLVILPAAEYVPVDGDRADVVRKVVALLVVGVVAVIIPWLLMIILAKKVGGPTRPQLHWQRSPFGQRLLGILRRLRLTAPLRFLWHRNAWILLFITVAVFLGLGLVPRFAAWIGLSATATLAIGALAGILSATALVLQDYWPETQLVDGGYIENTGLATITDLSDQWLGMARETNRRALTGNSPRPALVVPIIVFLTNADRNASQPALDTSPTSELAVPPTTYIRGGGALDSNEALLGRAQDAVALDGFCSSTLDQPACSALQRRFPSRVVVVDRLTQPEIGAPLGWVLSGASITSMDKAMIAQLDTHCPENQPDGGTPSAGGPSRSDGDVICRAGLATLGDLERYFTFTPSS